MKAVSKITGHVISGKIAEILCRKGKATEIIEEQRINEAIEAKEESVEETQEINEMEVENVDEVTEEQVIEQPETIEEVIEKPEILEISKVKKAGRPKVKK